MTTTDQSATDAQQHSAAQIDESVKRTRKKTEEHSDVEGRPQSVAAIVYNPIKVDLDLLKASVAAGESAAGWATTRWYETSVEDPGGGATRRAIEDGADTVIAAGGDGTVRAVAEALRGSDVSLALLPSGTGNLLARNLHLTLDDIDQSISTAFTGDDRPIDLGLLDIQRPDGSREQMAFVVMAGLGLDAKMIANTDSDLKKKVGWLAYVDAIIKSLRDENRMHVRYNLDGAGNQTARVHTVMVGNCGSLPGNIMLLPDASVDDGVFDIIALRPEGLFGWVQIWVKIVWENGVLRRSQVGRKIMGMTKEVRTLRYLKGRELVLRLDKPEVFELDGDEFGEAIAVKATVDHLALTVKVPARN